MKSPVATSTSAPAEGLGALLSDHPCRFLTVLVIGALLTLAGLAAVISNWRRPDDLMLVAGPLLLLMGIPCLIWAAVLRSNHAWCYERAFVVKCGPFRTIVPWEDVQQITQAVTRHSVDFVPTHTSHAYHVTRKDGKTWRFDDHYGQVETMARHVNANIIRLQLPRILEEFKNGQPVKFGTLQFDRKGISHGKTLVPWSEFRNLDFKDGYLRVHKHADGVRGALTGGTIVVHTTGLPNFYLLDAFAREIIGVRRRAQS